MNEVYLLPVFYTFALFFITQVLKKLLSIELSKSKKQKSKEEKLLEEEISQLKAEKEGLTKGQDSFVQESLLERKINKLLKQKEQLFKDENLLRGEERGALAALKKVLKAAIENSFLLSIIFYFLVRNERIPISMDAELFYPISSVLGFSAEGGITYFSVSFLFSYLVVRFCNKVGSIVFGD